MRPIIGFFIIGLLLSCETCIAQIAGKVVGVADGDTFTFLTADNRQIKIRLHGIDCPEKKQDYGQVAKKFTSDHIIGKKIEVDSLETDRYGRMIALVHLPDGQILNELLLTAGLAWHYKKYDNTAAWAYMEIDARIAGAGLWGMPNPVAPWEYRKGKK